MSGGQTANPFLEALKIRRKLTLHVFLGVLLLIGAAVFLTMQYSSSAVVALDPHSVSGGDQEKSPVELAWAALTDRKIQAVIQQFGLDSGMTRLRAQNQVFTYVRSNIVLHGLDSGGSGAPTTVEISFVGPSPSTVIDVTNAIAQDLTQPSAAPTRQAATVTPATTPNNAPSSALNNAPANTNNTNSAPTNTQANTSTNTLNSISEELEKSRATLQLMSQTQNASVPRGQLQDYFKTDTNLQAQRRQTVIELAALDQQKAQAALAASKARARAEAEAQAPPPPNPEAVELEQQIRQAQAHLAELRQRYTDNYPDVEEARETLANLQVKLSQIPPPKPRPRPTAQAAAPSAEQIAISNEEAQVLARQQGLDEAIKNNQNQAQRLRQRFGESKTFAQDYAFEQQRYNTLLQEQQQLQRQQQPPPQQQQAPQEQQQPQQQQPPPQQPQQPAPASTLDGAARPRFIIVQSATNATASGMGLTPPFWIVSALFALFVACFSAFVAEQFNPAAGNDVSPRSLHTS